MTENLDLITALKKEVSEQKALLLQFEKRVKSNKNKTVGNLRISKRNNTYQYYFRDEKSTTYKYVPVSELDKIKSFIQKEYDKNMIKKLKADIANTERFIKNYHPNILNNEYEDLPEGRKQFISPITLTDSMYIEKWYETSPGEMNTYHEKGSYETNRGEHVRSKSEKILADLFFEKHIPYIYEPEIQFKDGSVVYPDFILLNVRKRKTYIWEHLGMISDEAYATKNLKKVFQYEKNNYILGDKLLISEEADDIPIDLNIVNTKIEKYLM